MSLLPIPERVNTAQEAVLWAVFDRLQHIDENSGSRVALATTILYNTQTLNDRPLFADELAQLRQVLGLAAHETVDEPSSSRSFDEHIETIGRNDEL